jgi:hypothetical protein
VPIVETKLIFLLSATTVKISFAQSIDCQKSIGVLSSRLFVQKDLEKKSNSTTKGRLFEKGLWQTQGLVD